MSDGGERLATGVAGIDAILHGGLFHGGVYLVSGPPGTGKTIFGNEVAFAHARAGGKSIFCTLLAETHGRMLANIRKLSFFDEHAVGNAITYIEGFGALEESGLEGALKLLRDSVRDRKATLLVIDGTVTAERMSPSDIAYKKFIQGLKSWVDLIDCTVILLTSSGTDMSAVVQPEHTMVDGVIQFAARPLGMRMLREVCVRKFRGSAHLEGFHSYAINDDGIIAWPRTEALLANVHPSALSDERVPFGIPALDEMIDGGVRRNSVTLLVGATGVGKTQLGLQFLAEGVARGEPSLYFGLFEPPALIERMAQQLGLAVADVEHRLTIVWQPDTERLPDALAADLLRALDQSGARRVVVDGMVAFKTAAGDIERLPGFFSALTNELRRRGVTCMITEELRDMVNVALYVPVDNFSANCDNILFLRQVEEEGSLVRYISVAKTRSSPHDRTPHHFDVTANGIAVAKKRGAKARRKRRR
ncbi:MAG TPA: ATPase domain-containing protein [Polyangia bacterium]|jgi:circadian clock protein KaiC